MSSSKPSHEPVVMLPTEGLDVHLSSQQSCVVFNEDGTVSSFYVPTMPPEGGAPNMGCRQLMIAGKVLSTPILKALGEQLVVNSLKEQREAHAQAAPMQEVENPDTTEARTVLKKFMAPGSGSLQ